MTIKSLWQAVADINHEYRLIFRSDVPAHLNTELLALANQISGERMTQRDYDEKLVNVCGRLRSYV